MTNWEGEETSEKTVYVIRTDDQTWSKLTNQEDRYFYAQRESFLDTEVSEAATHGKGKKTKRDGFFRSAS